MVTELTDIQWDILFLSETRAPDDDKLVTGGHRLLTSNGGENHEGVALMIHSRWTSNILHVGRVSGRVMYADICIGLHIYRFIGVYLPHSGYSFQEFENAVMSMRGLLEDGMRLGYKCITGGDFNTQIGQGRRSNLLTDTFGETGMTISNLNEDFPLPEKWTFRSSLGILRQLDYIIANDSSICEEAGPIDYFDLGSDHRGVLAVYRIFQPLVINRRRATFKDTNWEEYRQKLDLLPANSISSLKDLESIMTSTASQSRANNLEARPTLSKELKALRWTRDSTEDKQERARLSKIISKRARQELRVIKNGRIQRVLDEFKNISSLDSLNSMPVVRKASQKPDFQGCADLLQQVYTADMPIPASGSEGTPSIPLCSFTEILGIVRKMKKNKAGDNTGVILELILYGGDSIIEYLVFFFNEILTTGRIPPSWKESFFILLHKGGPATDCNNWRPIAILSVIYKVFGRFIFSRIKATLNLHQSDEQFGFQEGKSTSDALLIMETMTWKALDQHLDFWVISVDLRKAFDRVEWTPLFQGLRKHGLSEDYCQLLQNLYSGQTGIVDGKTRFPICRGVRQGDILSPILFNSALENALCEWKTDLKDHGFAISPDSDISRLTNIRFADDLLLFGKSMEEAISMLELLVIRLRSYGLELNTKKTKMLSSDIT